MQDLIWKPSIYYDKFCSLILQKLKPHRIKFYNEE
jgi:hypothetical protein